MRRKLKEYIKRNLGATVVIFVVIIVCSLLILKNVRDKEFFKADVIDIITILLGALIAFYLTERMTDRRRRNDCIEHIIMEIESFVSDDNNFTIDRGTLLRHGSCGNRIKYLKDASFSDINKEISFIETQFEEIRELYSNHNKNQSELDTVKVDIDKRRDFIVDKCCKIRIGLYSYIKPKDETSH